MKKIATFYRENCIRLAVLAFTAAVGLSATSQASAQGITGMVDGWGEAVRAGIDFIVLACLLIGLGSVGYGLKLIVDKSNERADVKNSSIFAAIFGGSCLCMIWLIVTLLAETSGGSSSDLGAKASYSQ